MGVTCIRSFYALASIKQERLKIKMKKVKCLHAKMISN